MQATGNGLKSVLRTPGKTLLFILILTVTAALLMVSCCVYSVVRGYLTDCNSFFHTIAELEYIGQNYPDQTVYDESFANAVEHNRDTISQLIAFYAYQYDNEKTNGQDGYAGYTGKAIDQFQLTLAK